MPDRKTGRDMTTPRPDRPSISGETVEQAGTSGALQRILAASPGAMGRIP